MPERKSDPLSGKLLVTLGIPSIFFPGLILASILGWNWQNDLQHLAQGGGYKQSAAIFPATAVVTNVLDGDTFEIDNGQTVRMIGIDTPDRGVAGWEESTEYLKDISLCLGRM